MFEIISCSPDDARFLEMLPGIYADSSGAGPGNDIEPDHLLECLLVTRGKDVLGRIAVYQNPVLTQNGRPTVQFGNFECVNDPDAATALLNAGVELAGRAGAGFVIGPMNGSTWNQYRFMSERGDRPLFFTEQAHPDFYPVLWQEAGFSVFQEYASGIALLSNTSLDTAAFFAAHGLTVRGIQVDQLGDELEALYPLCTAAFAKSPLYSTISREKFITKLSALRPFLEDSLTKIAFDSAGTPLAFLLCLPDVFDASKQTLVLKTAARHPSCMIPGIASMLYRAVMSDALAAGYRNIVHAFMHIENTSLQRSFQFDGQLIRRYALYIRPC